MPIYFTANYWGCGETGIHAAFRTLWDKTHESSNLSIPTKIK
jgi:hypothetical protein